MRLRVLGTGPIHDGSLAACADAGVEVVDEAPYEYLVLANVTRILKPEEFTVASRGALCFHPSMLPRHRGADAVYWTFEMGDTETGVTWFWVDEGIDTGPIAIQRAVPIPPGIKRGDFYFGTLVPLGVEIFRELLEQLKRGETPSTVQDETKATYEPKRPKPEAAPS